MKDKIILLWKEHENNNEKDKNLYWNDYRLYKLGLIYVSLEVYLNLTSTYV